MPKSLEQQIKDAAESGDLEKVKELAVKLAGKASAKKAKTKKKTVRNIKKNVDKNQENDKIEEDLFFDEEDEEDFDNQSDDFDDEEDPDDFIHNASTSLSGKPFRKEKNRKNLWQDDLTLAVEDIELSKKIKQRTMSNSRPPEKMIKKRCIGCNKSMLIHPDEYRKNWSCNDCVVSRRGNS